MRILYIDIDTLRPDHLGCYGYPRNTSPTIDHIASEGVRFDNYFCSDAPCLPSRTALMTGKFGIHTGVVNHGGTNADIRPEGKDRAINGSLTWNSFPAMLCKAGLKTVSISPFAERHGSWCFYAGFSEIHNTGGRGGESAEHITPTVLKWIENNAAEDNWFLHVNYWDPHTPYRAPESFGNPFADDPLPPWLTEETIRDQRNRPGGHSAQDVTMFSAKTDPRYPRQPGEVKTMDDARAIFDGYDCGVAYADSHVAKLVEALSQKGVYDDLIVIVSADHGENLGELGLWAEHATADQITCRIPLIIRWPGLTSGHVDRGLHYNLDLLPTLAQLLGQQLSPEWDGESFAPAVRSATECGRDSLVLSQCCHGCQRSVRFDDWLYIRTYHDFFHLFEKEMLFNIATDPHEQHSLAQERPDICREAVYRYLEWHDSMMASMPHNADPLWEVLHEGGPYHSRKALPAYCERLEKTGRGWAVPELKKKYPEQFTNVIDQKP